MITYYKYGYCQNIKSVFKLSEIVRQHLKPYKRRDILKKYDITAQVFKWYGLPHAHILIWLVLIRNYMISRVETTFLLSGTRLHNLWGRYFHTFDKGLQTNSSSYPVWGFIISGEPTSTVLIKDCSRQQFRGHNRCP
ncbi:hypothetical protein CVS40_6782 [Lucilia cuprina]|nr:hypothetical protein CVS40_6782 [Lucilia cuprina]